MVLLIECVVACVAFTLIIVPSVKKNPLAWSFDYPPKIQARLKKLGLVESDKQIMSKPVILRKLGVSLAAAVVLALVLYFLNGADGFGSGFVNALAIWLSVTWFDAFIIDCAWFCHDKSIRIKGTEDMVSEYHNYGYHLLASCKGTLLGIPVCMITGGLTALFGLFFGMEVI